ncbi:MAG: aminoglycoside phosphotransferase family protein [Clostridia bacterium]|nr:aminoglycoside phosphotransferase family protein [Clostridia bacterium]
MLRLRKFKGSVSIMINNQVIEAFNSFGRDGDIISIAQVTTGLVNATYLVITETGKKYMLQKINTYAFKNPAELMENIVGVTKYLREKIKEAGGDWTRETLTFIRNRSGEYFYVDSEGDAWRLYKYIDNSFTYNKAETGEMFKDAGQAFGHFMNQLAEYPADTLHETIVNFHNTPARYNDFMKAVDEDAKGRMVEVLKEIKFVMDRKADTSKLTDLMEKGILPVRVTHNDTKLNNVLFDKTTNKSLCVIDLDTVMPGLSAYDFGDSIRSGANTADEDETDLSLVSIDLAYFENYVDGYLSETASVLNDAEIESLAFGAKLLTFECGMRFLTDYLNGDKYFRITHPEHNLERARNQFRLVESMEKNMDKMQAIVAKYKGKYRA